MPISEAEKEVLFHQPAALKQTSDSADPHKKSAPPSKRVVRPSAEPMSDVLRGQSAMSPIEKRPVPPASPSAAETADARAEFAAAAARARAAVAHQQAEPSTPSQPAATPVPQPVAPAPARPPAQAPATTPAPAPVQAKRSRIPAPRTTKESPLAAATQARPKQQVPQAPAVPAQRAPQQQARVEQQAPVAKPAPAAQAEPPAPAARREVAPAQAPAPAPAPARVRAKVEAEPAPAPVTEAPPQQRQKRASGKDFLLHTHGLKKVYDGRAVVNGVDVTVRPSEIVGLLGPNGAGKTTSFYMIVGLIQPNGGSVTFNGKDATNEPMYRRARLGMGYLPQEESIFRKLSVEDNILAVMETQDIPRSERRDRCNELMKRFGIDKLAKNEAITLSGGEKRRLTIARSLVTSPKLLMLDEPFSGVDPIAVGEIQEIVRSLREQGLAILITDHNVRETLDIVDRAYLLFEGRVEREGTRDFLINDPLSRQLYLGERFSM